MFFFYDNVATIMVAVVACTFAWVFGGTRAEFINPVMPWIFAMLVEVMIFFPQRHAGETTYEARERVWRQLKADPLVWVTLVFFALLAIPFINKGLCPICDYAAIQFGNADPAPPIPFLPFCVNRAHHYSVVLWFVPALTTMIAVKHSLLKRGKRMFLEMVVWNGFALAILGFVQQVTGAKDPLWHDFGPNPVYFFSTFGYPNMAGDYFTTMFGLAVGLWRWKLEVARADEKADDGDSHKRSSSQGFWRKNIMLVPAVFLYFAALTTLSRAAILLSTALATVFFCHSFVCLVARLPKAKRVKASAVSVFAMVAVALCAVAFMPDDFQREVGTIDATEVLDRVTGRGYYHTRVATEVWKDNILFGCGGWGYKHFCVPKMTDAEIKHIQAVGGVNVHNDYLQFLAEHGVVGFACLVVIVLMLVWPLGRIWKALADSIRFVPPEKQPPRPRALFILPAPVFCILATAVATFIHSFGDCAMRSPAVLTVFFASLAAMDGFLPTVKDKN